MIGENRPIFLEQLDCTSTDIKLLECSSFSTLGIHGCTHSQDVSVQCTGRVLSEEVEMPLNCSLQMLMSVKATPVSIPAKTPSEASSAAVMQVIFWKATVTAARVRLSSCSYSAL